jgi:AraC-like DNA-binding protein
LSEQDIARHKDNLISYLEQEKPYTDPDLQLQNLADHLGIPSYQLSQIINTELRQNFYELINSLRIAEAKHRLIDPANQHITILAIAYDIGFNSKSTFNTAFKKYTKMTPSQFKKSEMAKAAS